MNKDELKGKAEHLKNKVKEAADSLLGDRKKQAEGFVDRMRDAVKEKLGKGKDEAAEKAEGAGQASREHEHGEDDDE